MNKYTHTVVDDVIMTKCENTGFETPRHDKVENKGSDGDYLGRQLYNMGL